MRMVAKFLGYISSPEAAPLPHLGVTEGLFLLFVLLRQDVFVGINVQRILLEPGSLQHGASRQMTVADLHSATMLMRFCVGAQSH